MATHRRTWQKAEARVADLFGCRRQPGSGSGGREDLTRSDSNHPRLFIESKLRVRHSVRTLHDGTRELARREGKVPVLALADKCRPGFLVCIHSDDLPAVLAEFLASMDDPAHAPETVKRRGHRVGNKGAPGGSNSRPESTTDPLPHAQVVNSLERD